MNEVRWQHLMDQFGLSKNQDTFESLVNAHRQSHRHYHTTDHITAALNHLEDVSDFADEPDEIAMALWFHDAVYKPFSSTNEKDSAVWARDFLAANNVPAIRRDRVYELIMATCHNAECTNLDQQLMVDIDLTILGSSPSVYQIFEKAVRMEYRRVPWFLYRSKRKQILNSFLARPRIYYHQWFFDRFEQQARQNLVGAIEGL